MVRSLALLLGLAMIALPLCPAQSCSHSCCPNQPQSCDMADLSSSMHCAQAPPAPAVPRTTGTVLMQDSALALATVAMVVTPQQRTLERSRLSGGPSGATTSPLRI